MQKEGRGKDDLHPIKVASGNRSSGAVAEVAGAFAMQKAGGGKDHLCPAKVISDDALAEPSAQEVRFGCPSEHLPHHRVHNPSSSHVLIHCDTPTAAQRKEVEDNGRVKAVTHTKWSAQEDKNCPMVSCCILFYHSPL